MFRVFVRRKKRPLKDVNTYLHIHEHDGAPGKKTNQKSTFFNLLDDGTKFFRFFGFCINISKLLNTLPRCATDIRKHALLQYWI